MKDRLITLHKSLFDDVNKEKYKRYSFLSDAESLIEQDDNVYEDDLIISIRNILEQSNVELEKKKEAKALLIEWYKANPLDLKDAVETLLNICDNLNVYEHPDDNNTVNLIEERLKYLDEE